jgi:hypothetical protein
MNRKMIGEAIYIGTGYEYDGNVFVAWVLQVLRFYWNKNKLETENYIKNS